MGLVLAIMGVFVGHSMAVGLGAGLLALVCAGGWLDSLLDVDALAQRVEDEQAKYVLPSAFPDPPGMPALTRLYMSGKIDVDQYTEAAEALPWTPTDSSRQAAIRATFPSGLPVLPAGAATAIRTGDIKAETIKAGWITSGPEPPITWEAYQAQKSVDRNT